MESLNAKKELIRDYKEKKQLGCVYLLKNQQNGKALLLTAADLAGAENRFHFAQQTRSCVHPKLQQDWGDGSQFVMELVETLERPEDGDNKSFAGELKELAQLCKEKFPGQAWY